MGNVETLSSGSSSLDKRKIIDLSSMDGYSDEHSMCLCTFCHCFYLLLLSVMCVCLCVCLCVMVCCIRL